MLSSLLLVRLGLISLATLSFSTSAFSQTVGGEDQHHQLLRLQTPTIDQQTSTTFDCANTTHQWSSYNGSCFDESEYLPALDLPKEPPRVFGRFLGGIGLTPRDGICGPDQTSCWVVNCCEPGELCGDVTVGCIISWSTLYTTTVSTQYTTFTSILTPHLSSTATVSSTSTAFETSTTDVTVPGAGLETIQQTSLTTTTTLILSAYTPTASTLLSTVTSTVVKGINTGNTAPASITASPNGKAIGRLHKRTQRTSYTTLTVFVTHFESAFATSTYTGSVATVTQMVYTTLTAVSTNQHYSTTTGFTTITVNSTSTYSSYAFGTVDANTLTIVSTRMLTSDSAETASPSLNQGAGGASQPTNAPASNSGQRKHLSSGAIAGIVIGVLLLLALILALILFCCCCKNRKGGEGYAGSRTRRRERRDRSASPPILPEPPIPQPSMTEVHNQSTVTRPAATAGSGVGGYAYNNPRLNGRKSSRSSIVSISPVPEEAEEDEYSSSSPENGVPSPSPRRDSGESTRSWGRGYGGRGGYGGLRRNNNLSPVSVGNNNNNNISPVNGNPAIDSGLTGAGQGGRINRISPENASGNNSPVNPQFRGVMTSTYNDGSLVPPHERRF